MGADDLGDKLAAAAAAHVAGRIDDGVGPEEAAGEGGELGDREAAQAADGAEAGHAGGHDGEARGGAGGCDSPEKGKRSAGADG